MSSARSIAAIASLPQSSLCEETLTGDSLCTNPGLPQHLAPVRVVIADDLGELRRRAGHDVHALRYEARLDLGGIEDFQHFRVHFGHDVGRCFGRDEKAEPRI